MWRTSRVLLGALLVVLPALGAGQTTSRTRVRLLSAGSIARDPSVSGVQRLLDGVALGYRDAVLNCDSAWRYDDGRFEAMGRVVLTDRSGLVMRSSRMLLDPEGDAVTATGRLGLPVTLRDRTGELEAPVIRYDTEARVATYTSGGTLKREGRTVRSRTGRYDVESGWLQLGGAVRMTSSDESVTCDSLLYRASDSTVRFLSPTRVTTADGRYDVSCSRGLWVLDRETGWLGGSPARVRRDGDVLEADSIAIDGPDGPTTAVGHVLAWDTAGTWWSRGVSLWRTAEGVGGVVGTVGGVGSERAHFLTVTDGDTLWVTADTLYTSDSELRAFPRARARVSGMDALCDTLVWASADSVLDLHGSPRVWFDGRLLVADSVQAATDQGKLTGFRAAGHAVVVAEVQELADSLSGFDQIAGRLIEGDFADGELVHLRVTGNSEAVVVDADDPARPSVNRATGSRLRLDFIARELEQVALLDGPTGRWDQFPAAEGLAFRVEGFRWEPAPAEVDFGGIFPTLARP